VIDRFLLAEHVQSQWMIERHIDLNPDRQILTGGTYLVPADDRERLKDPSPT